MSDIAAAERRLAAALDRIDVLLEHQPASAGPDADDTLQKRLEEAESENARLRRQVAAASDSRASGANDAAMADLQARLASTGDEAARLAAANDALAEANRALIAAQSGQGDVAEITATALEAEIEALRAARAAEIAQLADIVGELDRLLSGGTSAPRSAATPAVVARAEAAATASGASATQVLEDEAADAGEPAGFGAVYGDEADDALDDDMSGDR